MRDDADPITLTSNPAGNSPDFEAKDGTSIGTGYSSEWLNEIPMFCVIGLTRNITCVVVKVMLAGEKEPILKKAFDGSGSEAFQQYTTPKSFLSLFFI